MYLSKLSAPIIPFTPLLLKDMTFAHEGNLTFIGKGMINFEKMVSALIWPFSISRFSRTLYGLHNMERS